VPDRVRSIAVEDEPRRQRRPQEKLARILASATTTFGEVGYARARIHDVCRSAGVSIGTFYDHFENKADLMLRVAEDATESIPLPEAATRSQLEDYVAALAAAPTAGISRAWIEAIGIEPGLRLANERIRGIFFGRYRRWVADSRVRRRVQPAVDDEVTARAVMTLLREATNGTYGPADVRVAEMARAIWFLVYAE
jgi:AcrR family transcriptional regulator